MKVVISFIVVLFSSQLFAGACFTDMGIASIPTTCAEYSSSDLNTMTLMEDSCEANPHSSWVNSCSNAKFGCKVEQVGITTTIWYINNEPKNIIDMACSAVQGTVVSK